jgi:hypothetical protein
MVDHLIRYTPKSTCPNSEANALPLVRSRSRGKPLSADIGVPPAPTANIHTAAVPEQSRPDAFQGQNVARSTRGPTPSLAATVASNAGHATDRTEGPTSTYTVGRNRPPKHTQFKKGQSGNPKGRPKGAKNIWTILQEEADAMVAFTENGKPTKASKTTLAIKSAMNKAVKGDLRALHLILRLFEKHGPPHTEVDAETAQQSEIAANRVETDAEILEMLGLSAFVTPRRDTAPSPVVPPEKPPVQ